MIVRPFRRNLGGIHYFVFRIESPTHRTDTHGRSVAAAVVCRSISGSCLLNDPILETVSISTHRCGISFRIPDIVIRHLCKAVGQDGIRCSQCQDAVIRVFHVATEELKVLGSYVTELVDTPYDVPNDTSNHTLTVLVILLT